MRAMLPLFALALSAQAPPAEKQVVVTSFDRVRVSGPFTVEIAAGSPRAQVTGDATALASVRVSVEGSTLVIVPARDGERPAPAGTGLRIRVQGSGIRSASLIGAGALRIERLAGTRVELTLTGSGAIDAGAADADQLVANVIGSGTLTLRGGRVRAARFLVNGAGGIDAAALATDTLFVRQQGAATGRYAARYEADVAGSGAGTIDVAGSPRCRTAGTSAIRCQGVR